MRCLLNGLRFNVREIIAVLLTVETGTVLVDAFELTVALIVETDVVVGTKPVDGVTLVTTGG